jgi:hypothetical protein
MIKKQTATRELRPRSKILREHDAGGSLHPHAFFAESDEGRKYAALMRLMGR